MKIKVRHIFSLLCLAFLMFSLRIYVYPLKKLKAQEFNKVSAVEGRLVWQKYNCQCCHQLYGLGGYLGPDLTNEYSKFQGNEDILKALFKGGMKQMPAFNLSKTEENFLIEFLKQTDASGNANPRNYSIHKNGMIEQNERK